MIEFNSKQKLIIKEYQVLLIFGYSKIGKIQLDLNKTRMRKKVLYFLMGAMQSFSESILKLSSSIPVYERASESLLRSQFELLLNIRYIYSSRSEVNARYFFSDMLMESIKFANKHKQLWLEHPDWNLKFGNIQKPSDWDNFVQRNLKIIQKYRSKYKDCQIKQMPKLYERVQKIDNYLMRIGKLNEKTSAKKQYIYYYHYFSQSTHLNMSGLQTFLQGKGGVNIFNIDSKPEDIEKPLSVSYCAYFDSLVFFTKVFNIYNKIEFSRFKHFIKKEIM